MPALVIALLLAHFASAGDDALTTVPAAPPPASSRLATVLPLGIPPGWTVGSVQALLLMPSDDARYRPNAVVACEAGPAAESPEAQSSAVLASTQARLGEKFRTLDQRHVTVAGADALLVTVMIALDAFGEGSDSAGSFYGKFAYQNALFFRHSDMNCSVTLTTRDDLTLLRKETDLLLSAMQGAGAP